MELFKLTIALAMPWLFGTAILHAWFNYRNRPLHRFALIGYGFPLGMLFTSLLMRSVSFNFTFLTLLLGAGLSIFSCILLWQSHQRPRSTHSVAGSGGRSPRHTQAIVWLLSSVLLVRLYALSTEILLRPLYPWDAWSNWAIKSHVWFHFGAQIPFVDAEHWSQLASAESYYYTIPAWHYPDTIPLIQTWIALALGSWDDALINLPWLFCPVALALGLYGQAHAAGVSISHRMIGVYLLLSLPMFNAHTALAGYADLWLAVFYGLGSFSIFNSLRQPSLEQTTLALLCAAACPLVKQEGLVLILTWIPPLVVRFAAPGLFRLSAALTALLLLALTGALIAFPEGVTLEPPYLGTFTIAYHSVWSAFLDNYLLFNNWHLFWYIWLAIVLFSLFQARARTRLYFAALSLPLSALIYLFTVFFLTQNYAWAVNYTSLNRLTLHLVPMFLFFALLVFNRSFQNCQVLSQTP